MPPARSPWRTHWLLLAGLLLGGLQQGYDFFPRMIMANHEGRVYFFQQFLDNKLPSPLAYRPLSYWLEILTLDLIPKINLGHADLIINAVCTAIALTLIVRFSERHVSATGALLVALWVYVCLPIGFQEHLHQPSDFPNLVAASALYGLAAALPPLTILGLAVFATLNRESFVILLGFPVMLHLLSGTLRDQWRGLVTGFGGCILTGLLVLGMVGKRPGYEKFIMLPDNLSRDYVIAWLPDVLYGLVPALALGFWGWRWISPTSRAALVFTCGFLALMMVIGRFPEFRLFFPILPLICLAGVEAIEKRPQVPVPESAVR